MIKNLYIKNYILIDELNLIFDPKFNAIIGETGAGKSIIISAIDIVFGAKVANKEVIKKNEACASIEVVLRLSDNFDKTMLIDNGITDFDDEIVLSREITPSSSRCRLNGTLVSLDFVRELKTKLLDIHSQHQSYSYMAPKYHIHLLDNFDKHAHQELLNNYKAIFEKYQNLTNELKALENTSTLNQNQIDFLRFQIDEIECANILSEDEDEKIISKLQILENSEKLKEYTYNAYSVLYEGEDNIIDRLSFVKNNIQKCVSSDSYFDSISETLENVYELLRDSSSQIRSYFDNISFDEQTFNELNERVDVLNKLKRKYGPTLKDVLANYQKFKDEYNKIETKDEQILQIKKKIQELLPSLESSGQILTQSRQNLAARLSKMMEKALIKLELPKTKFEVKLTKTDFNEFGCDNVEFMLSTNVSEEVKPLAKVASGGEISRVMLGLKTIFAHADSIDTCIFDEIDTGISGKASISVGNAINVLSQTHQVICISHQPIIMSRADNILYVSKTQDDETKINVNKLNENEKIQAIAMLAGGKINEETIKFAKDLIDEAKSNDKNYVSAK